MAFSGQTTKSMTKILQTMDVTKIQQSMDQFEQVIMPEHGEEHTQNFNAHVNAPFLVLSGR